jgi:hypothetical protein
MRGIKYFSSSASPALMIAVVLTAIGRALPVLVVSVLSLWVVEGLEVRRDGRRPPEARQARIGRDCAIVGFTILTESVLHAPDGAHYQKSVILWALVGFLVSVLAILRIAELRDAHSAPIEVGAAPLCQHE